MERPAGPRLLRTYARKGACVRRLSPPAPWLSPPQDRQRLFGSSSAASGSSSAASGHSGSEDPDFRPHRRALLPPARSHVRVRRKKGRDGGPRPKENRGPASCSPRRRHVTSRRRRGAPPSLGRRPTRPLLCSTPQPPRRSPPEDEPEGNALGGCREHGTPSTAASGRALRLRRAPFRNVLAELSPLAPGAGRELFSSPRPLLKEDSGGRSRTAAGPARTQSCLFLHGAGGQPQPSRGDLIQLAPSPFPATGQPPPPLRKTASRDPGPRLTSPKAGRAQRTTQASLPWHNVDDQRVAVPRACKPAVLVHGHASCDESHDELRKESLSTDKSRLQLQPWVVLSSEVVPTWLANRKINDKLEAWSSGGEDDYQQPVSPFSQSVISEKKSTSSKVIPRNCGGGTSKKACISGFSSSRWGKQAMRRKVRCKNKKTPWHQTDGSFEEQMRQRGMEKNASEMSSFLLDSSFLNNSQWWVRARASLSFHKKKKVAIEERACGFIPCTPSSKSHLAEYHKSPFIQNVDYSIWPTSSITLLTPLKPHSVVEEMLTDAEKVYGECQQEGPISFEECIPPSKMKNCLKIGEGVFGEVFQTNSERGTVALKIIPVEGTEKVNGEAQKSFGEILPEIIISKELSLLSQEVENRTVGFIGLYSVHCVQGAYPEHLLKAWDKYHKLKGSENDRPDLFGEQQLFMVLEFEFGGSDLENMRKQLNSVATAKSLLHQITASLAVAEEELRFEHRDLHWGNILVKKTNLKELNYTLNGAIYTIPTKGIHVNIIDYTLSRLEKDGLTVFCDISTDKELFQGRGDYQFDIYRQMKEENSNNWADYHSHSNVLWLHYLADKLLRAVCYKTRTASSAMKRIQKQLQKFYREVLNFRSAKDVLLNSSLFH
uniref:Serine/threonine-protein kinase haspin n=1 Tax=Pelusios castaneus TaxID=367368 RepID=A0A8C8SAH9_9SAUR